MSHSTKSLYRDPVNGAICGICAGFADYFNQDVVLVRVVATVLLLFFSGITLIAYIILRLVLPEKPVSGRVFEHPPENPKS